LLDTGADSVFISQAVAKQLKLEAVPRQALQVSGFCGLEAAERINLSRVELGRHHQTNLEGIILSSPMLSQMEVDGILGQEFFNHYQQHWRFSRVDSPQAAGSLLLTPLTTNNSP
jgi:predicted aspartyl protease